MFRRIEWIIIALATVIAAGSAPADEVDAFLERHGLTELLAVHLEERLELARGEEKEELLVRLAGLYAQLLETVTDPARRLELEDRSRRLVQLAPSGSTDELRFALLRGSYRAAEKVAEKHRLRQADDEEVQRAIDSLGELIPDLTRLRDHLRDRMNLMERRLSRAAGTDAIILAEQIEEARRLRAQCTFLTAWSLYYQSMLNERPDNARTAQRFFIELLDFKDHAVAPENVSVDLRGVEAVARCVLGMALCKSLTSSSPIALSWLSLLEHERAYELLRDEAPAWRIVIYLEHQQYRDVRGVLDARAASGVRVPVHWLRLVVVHALEARERTGGASDLARYALTELAARGELQQVFDLAERYGVESIGARGFAPRYVRGVLKYHQAREQHEGDEPTDDPEIGALFQEAAAEFEAARREPDADQHPNAAPDCGRLIAWCAYFRGEYLTARDAFERAAEQLSTEQAADALWMAVVCLDRQIEADGGDRLLADELARLVSRFLESYPSSPHAPKLVLRRALTSEEISMELADELLEIPPNSEVYPAARRRAAHILYQLFREATPAQRIAVGNKYLSVARPLHADEDRNLDPSDPAAVQRYLILGRRLLEVALQDGIARLVAARATLKRFEELRREGVVDLDDVQPELSYRQLQVWLLNDDAEAAAQIAEEMYVADSTALWSRLAARAMFRDANARWRDAQATGSLDRAAAAMVIRFGSRVLDEYAGDADALRRTTVMSSYAAVAQAAMEVWERSGDAETGRRALALFETLLEVRPNNAAFLRSAALLCERLDRRERALQCWRTLVAGTPSETDGWFEAKFHLIDLLARSDPNRARVVMDQHKQLNPDYGPDPWGARLKALDLRLGPSTAGEAAEDDGSSAAARETTGEARL